MNRVVLPVSDAHRKAWSAHVQGVFSQLGIPSGTLADNLVESISMYCQKFHPHGLQTNDLNLLMARAFCSVDEHAAAAHILESMVPHRRHVDRWLEILSELHHFPQLLPYFSLGIIRPADWAGARLDRMWTLDFGRLALADAERHEMMLYRTIRTLLEKMFVFWDATGGEGILGLKNLAELDLEERRESGQTMTSESDLLEYISSLFTQHLSECSWETVPSLLNLDL